MPTIHKPQLDHAPFPWHERPNEFQKELEAQRSQILELSGFNKEFGDPADAPSNNTKRRGTSLFRDLTATFQLPRTSKWNAVKNPPTNSTPTLKSFERNRPPFFP